MIGETNEYLNKLLQVEQHRLCFDFDTIDTLREFFGRCKADGITHPDSVPALLFSDKDKTVWLVKRNNPTKKNPDGTLIHKLSGQ